MYMANDRQRKKQQAKKTSIDVASDEKEKKKKLIIFCISIITCSVAILTFLLNTYNSNLFKKVKTTGIYMIPYTVTNVDLFSSFDNIEFNEMLIARVNFKNSGSKASLITDSKIKIHSIAPADTPRLIAAAIVSDTKDKLAIYICNNDTIEGNSLNFKLYFQDHNLNNAYNHTVDSIYPTETPIITYPELKGGDIRRLYLLDLNDSNFEKMVNGRSMAISIYLDITGNGISESRWLGNITYSHEEYGITLSEGGDGVFDELGYYVKFINTDAGSITDSIQLQTPKSIKEVGYTETFIIPDKSCHIIFSLIYTIDGKYTVESDVFDAVVRVPLYNESVLNTMQYYDIETYSKNEDAILEKEIKYIPVKDKWDTISPKNQ